MLNQGRFQTKSDSIGGLGGTACYKETFKYFLANREIIKPDCASEIDFEPLFSDSFTICFNAAVHQSYLFLCLLGKL